MYSVKTNIGRCGASIMDYAVWVAATWQFPDHFVTIHWSPCILRGCFLVSHDRSPGHHHRRPPRWYNFPISTLCQKGHVASYMMKCYLHREPRGVVKSFHRFPSHRIHRRLVIPRGQSSTDLRYTLSRIPRNIHIQSSRSVHMYNLYLLVKIDSKL